MEQEDRVFYLSSEEAEIVAKAETGIGDLPRQLSMGMVIMLMAVIVLRMVLDLPLPSFRMLGAYTVAIVAWIILVSFSRVRISRTTEELIPLIPCNVERHTDGRKRDSDIQNHLPHGQTVSPENCPFCSRT